MKGHFHHISFNRCLEQLYVFVFLFDAEQLSFLNILKNLSISKSVPFILCSNNVFRWSGSRSYIYQSSSDSKTCRQSSQKYHN